LTTAPGSSAEVLVSAAQMEGAATIRQIANKVFMIGDFCE
jgi:hypothetical protein